MHLRNFMNKTGSGFVHAGRDVITVSLEVSHKIRCQGVCLPTKIMIEEKVKLERGANYSGHH